MSKTATEKMGCTYDANGKLQTHTKHIRNATVLQDGPNGTLQSFITEL